MRARWCQTAVFAMPLLAGVAVARQAAAEPAVRACIAEHTDGQVLRLGVDLLFDADANDPPTSLLKPVECGRGGIDSYMCLRREQNPGGFLAVE